MRAKLEQGAHYLTHQATTSALSSVGAVAANTASTHPGLKPIQPSPQSHGYDDSSGLETQSHIHPQLRTTSNIVPASDMMQRGVSPPSDEGGPVSTSPVGGMGAQGLLGHDTDDSVADGRKAKRELSQSKRAAQNRAAQVSGYLVPFLIQYFYDLIVPSWSGRIHCILCRHACLQCGRLTNASLT